MRNDISTLSTEGSAPLYQHVIRPACIHGRIACASGGLEHFVIEMLSESSGARLISALLIRKALRANG